jgi:hypothetical protein
VRCPEFVRLRQSHCRLILSDRIMHRNRRAQSVAVLHQHLRPETQLTGLAVGLPIQYAFPSRLCSGGSHYGAEVSLDGIEKRMEGATGDKSPHVPEKKCGADRKNKTCKSVEHEENQEKGLRGSWARIQMGNFG